MEPGSSKNRRRHARLFRNVRFLFYFLGQTREVYSVDISTTGAFIQTDIFPPLGSFIILEHYHLKKRGITLGMVGRIRRIQTPYQAAPNIRGVGVEWVRVYCNQGFASLKQFFEKDLGHNPFDWEMQLTYGEYERKIVYDFSSESLSPTPAEMEVIKGARRRPASDVEKRDTAPDGRAKPAQAEGPGAVIDASLDAQDMPGEPLPDDGEATRTPTVRMKARPGATGEVSAPPQKVVHADAPPMVGEVDPDVGELIPVDIKVVLGIGNRMSYGRVEGLNERYLRAVNTSPHMIKEGAKVQVRLPLAAKAYRYMVVIFGRVVSVSEMADGEALLLMRIESIDEFQNPGGFRYYLQGLARKG